MTQLSEQDRQRIENDSITHKEYKTLESVSAYSEHRRWKNGYTTGATAERLLAESEKEELRKKWDCDKAALNEAVRKCNHYESEKEELTEVLGMAKAHRRDCTYSPQDLTQQDKEMTALRKRVEELESLLRSAMGYNSTGHSVPNHMCELIDRLLNQPTKP